MEELDQAIAATNDKSSPGPDGIDYKILRILPHGYKDNLLKLFNSILESRVYPGEWKEFGVFFIPKKDSNKFRPISLAQCILKLLERLIFNRLYIWLETNNKLPNSQFGFRANRSCTDNLAILIANIHHKWNGNHLTGAIFVDIKGAFDNVLWDVLLDRLSAMGIPDSFLAFIYNLVSNRTVQFKFNDIDCIKPMNLLKFLRRTWWVSDPNLLLRIYKSLIRSRMEYGALVWSELPQYLWKRLFAIQHQAIRLYMGYMRSTPINVMMAETREPRLDLRIKYLSSNYISKILSATNHELLPILNDIQADRENPTFIEKHPPPYFLNSLSECSKFSHLLETSSVPTFCRYSTQLQTKHLNISFLEGKNIKESTSANTKFESIFSLQDDSLHLFTDGSKIKDHPYAEFAVKDRTGEINLKFRTSNMASIFSCEAMAIIDRGT